MRRFLLAILLALSAAPFAAGAREAAPVGQDPVIERRMMALAEELRCLVCQNQTLADSNADLADDLRREVRALAVAGKSDDEIRSYLVARYGDFVLYDPPVKPLTWLLWFGPFALLVGGAAVWWVVLQRRSKMLPKSELTAEAQSRGRALLDEEQD